MEFKRLNQQELDVIQNNLMMKDEFLAYITIDKYLGRWEVGDSDWAYLAFGHKNSFLHISFDRNRDLEISIALYCESSFVAGKFIKLIEKIIHSYKPRAINSSVHASNVKSLILNRKMFGKEYAVKQSYAWNMATGEYEDLVLFRKILNYGKDSRDTIK